MYFPNTHDTTYVIVTYVADKKRSRSFVGAPLHGAPLAGRSPLVDGGPGVGPAPLASHGKHTHVFLGQLCVCRQKRIVKRTKFNK